MAMNVTSFDEKFPYFERPFAGWLFYGKSREKKNRTKNTGNEIIQTR